MRRLAQPLPSEDLAPSPTCAFRASRLRRGRCGNWVDVTWLLISIVASVALTVVLNLGLRAFPGAGDRAARGMFERLPDEPTAEWGGRREVRVWFPWKAMLIASVLLTLVLNLVL